MRDTDKSDLLYGLEAIGGFLSMTTRQVKHRALAGQIPTFKVGGTTCASRTAIDQWVAAQAKPAAARKAS